MNETKWRKLPVEDFKIECECGHRFGLHAWRNQKCSTYEVKKGYICTCTEARESIWGEIKKIREREGKRNETL